MNNRIKKFIDHNRRAFDDDIPAGHVWDKISEKLPQQSKTKTFSIKDIYKWSIAAAVVCITLTSVYFLLIRNNSPEMITAESEAASNKTNNHDYLVNIPPEYADEVKTAYGIIQARQQELRSSAAASPELYKQFSRDLAALDSSYRVLKTEVQHTPNGELIIRAMLNNLQLQGELLSRQLMIIREFGNGKKQRDEKTI